MESNRVWTLVHSAEHDLLAMPAAGLAAGAKPIATVRVIRRDEVPPGSLERTAHVRENAQEFDVAYYQFDGYHGLLHGRGNNWILWSDDHAQFLVTETESSAEQTWVHARFILRHLIVDQFMARPGFRPLHAAAGTLTDRSGLLIAGNYLSGKTYLLNALIQRGLLLDWVEDDCAAIDPDLIVHALIPAPDSVRQTRELRLSVMICLDSACAAAERIETRDALRWALPIRAPWPVSWLPRRSTHSADLPEFTRELICLRVPERPAPDRVIDALRRYAPDSF